VGRVGISRKERKKRRGKRAVARGGENYRSLSTQHGENSICYFLPMGQLQEVEESLDRGSSLKRVERDK